MLTGGIKLLFAPTAVDCCREEVQRLWEGVGKSFFDTVLPVFACPEIEGRERKWVVGLRSFFGGGRIL